MYWNKMQDSFELGHNMFSTMTEMEAKRMSTGLVYNHEEDIEPTMFDDSNLTDSIDWRAKGAVNPIKNQGSCMAGQAFGPTGAIEAAH